MLHGICFSLSDLLHSVWQSLGVCCKWHYFILFMTNIPLYICTTSSLSIPGLIDILPRFHILDIENNTAVNIRVHVSF